MYFFWTNIGFHLHCTTLRPCYTYVVTTYTNLHLLWLDGWCTESESGNRNENCHTSKNECREKKKQDKNVFGNYVLSHSQMILEYWIHCMKRTFQKKNPKHFLFQQQNDESKIWNHASITYLFFDYIFHGFP